MLEASEFLIFHFLFQCTKWSAILMFRASEQNNWEAMLSTGALTKVRVGVIAFKGYNKMKKRAMLFCFDE